jgi:hypothetical protein
MKHAVTVYFLFLAAFAGFVIGIKTCVYRLRKQIITNVADANAIHETLPVSGGNGSNINHPNTPNATHNQILSNQLYHLECFLSYFEIAALFLPWIGLGLLLCTVPPESRLLLVITATVISVAQYMSVFVSMFKSITSFFSIKNRSKAKK